MKHRSFNILGNIAVVNFHDFAPPTSASLPRHRPEFTAKLRISFKEKKTFAEQLLKEHPNIKTILEKSGKFKGRLRKMKTKYLAGEKNKEILYKENNCVFRFNIDTTYFSPRLSNERKEIASMIKKTDKVLVMFAGVGPYSICIAKNSKAKVYSNEINREANKYAELNIKLNNLKDRVELIPGDVKKITKKLSHYPISHPIRNPARNYKNKFVSQSCSPTQRNANEKKSDELNKIPNNFDVIVMPRPKLKESFLKEAFALSKNGTKIFYYDFCKVEDKNKIIEKIKNEAKKAKKKIKILRIKHAGEIAPYKIRLRVDFKII